MKNVFFSIYGIVQDKIWKRMRIDPNDSVNRMVCDKVLNKVDRKVADVVVLMNKMTRKVEGL